MKRSYLVVRGMYINAQNTISYTLISMTKIKYDNTLSMTKIKYGKETYIVQRQYTDTMSLQVSVKKIGAYFITQQYYF